MEAITVPAEDLIKEIFVQYLAQRHMDCNSSFMELNIKVFGLYVENLLKDEFCIDEPEWEVD